MISKLPQEVARQLAIVSSEAVLRLRLKRSYLEDSFSGLKGLDVCVAFCPLSDFLGAVPSRKDKSWIHSSYAKDCVPIDHPPELVRKRLKSILSAHAILGKAFRIIEGPYSFECPQTGLWGVRVELESRKKLSGSASPAHPRGADSKWQDGALDDFFSRGSQAGGFALSSASVDEDIKDCTCLWSNAGALTSLVGLFERQRLHREIDSLSIPSGSKLSPRL